MRNLALTFALPLFLLSATASAHFDLTAPPSPANSKDGKGAPPCGPDTAAGTITPAMGGHELTISLNETVSHDGFYRVALSIKDRKELPVDNVVKDKDGVVLPPDHSTGVQSASALFDANPKFPILADNLFPHTGVGPKTYTAKIMLPNVNCDKCTLQVIEFMAGHGWNQGGGYFYHHCADLKITADSAMPIFDPAAPAGGSGAGGGSGMGGAATGGAGGLGGSSSGAGGVISGTGGVPGSGGTPGTSGTAPTTTAGTTATPTAGTGGSGTVTNPGGGDPQDGGGCGVSKNTQGGASALAALGLLFALGRRRRSR